MSKVTLIAEVASNAGGSVVRAEQFITSFAEAGADIVKFQLTRVKHLAKTDPQYDWFKLAEWNTEAVKAIVAKCLAEHVVPMFTVVHEADVHEVADLPYVKVASSESYKGKLAEAILNQPFERIFVSWGWAPDWPPPHEMYLADSRVTILGTCPHYPAPSGILSEFHRSAKLNGGGWSDHTIGIEEAHLATLLGYSTIEKHVQLPTQSREPRPYEATVSEFAELRRRVDFDAKARFIGRWNAA